MRHYNLDSTDLLIPSLLHESLENCCLGKTTVLNHLKLKKTVNTLPTIGFNVETVTPVKGLTLTIWDVGGQDRLRQLWKHYYSTTEGKPVTKSFENVSCWIICET